MKKILSLAILSIISTQLFATHYSQKGDVEQEESKYLIYDGKLVKMPEANNKLYYDFYSDCSGLKDNESGLVKTGLAEYIGASGRTHKIAEIFAMYEKRALSMGEQDLYFVGNHDTDVVVIFDKKGKTFTIDIYTGEDAIKQKEVLKK